MKAIEAGCLAVITSTGNHGLPQFVGDVVLVLSKCACHSPSCTEWKVEHDGLLADAKARGYRDFALAEEGLMRIDGHEPDEQDELAEDEWDFEYAQGLIRE